MEIRKIKQADLQNPGLNYPMVYIMEKNAFFLRNDSATTGDILIGYEGKKYTRVGELANTIVTENNVLNEIPAGGPAVFTTAYEFVVGSLEVFINGLKQQAADFSTPNGLGFTLTVSLEAGDYITVNYIKYDTNN